jgi:hypothetical protein
MDVPLSILTQRTNFLKGKFHLKCYDYKQAIEYFESALYYENIGDIEITLNSLEYLKKISKIYLNLVEKDIEVHTTNNNQKNKIELKEDKKRKEILIKYINDLTKEIKSYKYYPKDICIILNLGNLSSINNLNINENLSNVQKIVKYLYENITTEKDRFAILEYGKNNYKFLLSLQAKEENNEKKVNEVIDNIETLLYSSLNKNIKHTYSQSNLLNLINDSKKNNNKSNNKECLLFLFEVIFGKDLAVKYHDLFKLEEGKFIITNQGENNGEKKEINNKNDIGNNNDNEDEEKMKNKKEFCNRIGNDFKNIYISYLDKLIK